MDGLVTRRSNDIKDSPGYSDYLQLPRLLDSQVLVSDVPDEYMFIIAHQTSELWLAALIRELGRTMSALRKRDFETASTSLAVGVEIVNAMASVWPVLNTMTAENFGALRDKLGNASGLRSVQFRVFEAILGIADAKHAALFAPGSADYRLLQKAHAQATLMEVAQSVLLDVAISPKGQENLSTVRVDAWRLLMSDAKRHRSKNAVAQQLLALGSAVEVWRRAHIAIVTRLIGHARGTGGTSGEKYLKKALAKRIFPELVEASLSPVSDEAMVEVESV